MAASTKADRDGLADSDQTLQIIAGNVDEVIFMFTPDWRKAVYVSPAYQKIWGRPANDVYRDARSWTEAIVSGDRERVVAFIDGQSRGEVPFENSIEYRIRTRDGSIRWINGRTYPVRDGHGNITRVTGIAEDITGRKSAENRLRDSERFLNNIFDCFQDGISILDRDLNIVRVNHIMEKWYPHMMPLEGNKCYRVYHGRSAPCEKCPSARAIHEKTAQSEVVPFQGDDGRFKGWQELFAFPLKDDDGNVIGVIEHVRDITRRKQAEESLQLMRHVIDQAQDEASLAGPDGRFVYVNDAKCRSLGYAREELLSRYVWDVDPDMTPERWAMVWQDLKEKRHIKRETRHRTRDGRIFPTEIWSTFIDFQGREYVCAFVRDITERKDTEKSLMLTQFTMDRAGDMVLWVAPDSRFVYVNEAASRTFGYTREEMTAMTAFDTCPSWTEESWAEHWKEIKERGSFTFEASLRKKDGSFFPGEIAVNYLVYDGKEYNCSFIRDITERKKVEDAIRVASAYNRSLIEASLDPLVTIAPDGRITDVNAATEAVTGLPREALVSTDFSDYFTDPAKAREGYLTVFQEGSVTDYPLEIRHRDGRVTPVIYNASVYRDEAGKVTGVFAAARDITERKRAEDALQESERKFRVLAESTKAGIVLYRGRRFVYVNPTLEKMTGYGSEELMAMDFWNIVHPDYRELVRGRGFARQRGVKVPSTYEFRILTKQGEARWVELSAAIIDYEGKMTVMATVFDITDRKRSEEETREARAQAELYLDLMGHDINNLNQISIGFLEMALGTLKLDRESGELIARPLEAIRASSQLIANVRKLQKIKEGGLKFQEVRIADRLREIIPRYSDVPGRDVRINCDARSDCTVMANDLLDDVFSNIIHNAIKHSAGPLTIDVHLSTARVGDQEYALVAIEDDGPGIPDEQKGRLFARSGTAKATGRGLGLYLVWTLVEDFRGKVWVEDRIRGDHTRGTRFVIMLPVTDPKNP